MPILPVFSVVPMEGVEPTHSHEYQILSLARLPIPPHRLTDLTTRLACRTVPDARNIQEEDR